MTTVTPGASSMHAGAWKHKLFPKPVRSVTSTPWPASKAAMASTCAGRRVTEGQCLASAEAGPDGGGWSRTSRRLKVGRSRPSPDGRGKGTPLAQIHVGIPSWRERVGEPHISFSSLTYVSMQRRACFINCFCYCLSLLRKRW